MKKFAKGEIADEKEKYQFMKIVSAQVNILKVYERSGLQQIGGKPESGPRDHQRRFSPFLNLSGNQTSLKKHISHHQSGNQQ